MKVAKRQARLYETSIRYYGRTYDEGKKVRPRDGLKTLAVLLRYAITDDLYMDRGADILDGFSVARKFNRWMADTIRPFVGREVLEIGAGMGNLTRQLAPQRARYVATDLDGEHLARLESRLHHRPNLETAQCDLSNWADLQKFESQMDTVICLNVLEHIEDDLEGLRNIHACLAPEGRAIVLVPHGQNLYGKLDEVLGHYRRYSHAQLRDCMERAGFEVERVLDFNRISRPGWYVNGKLLKKDRITRAQLQLFDRTVWLWRKLDGSIPWQPTSIIAIGRKPATSASERSRHEFTEQAAS
jgi:SAM-dependent methyltransferase